MLATQCHKAALYYREKPNNSKILNPSELHTGSTENTRG